MILGNSSPTSVPGASAVCHVGAFNSGAVDLAGPRALKPHTSIAEQLTLLRSRGLAIDDEHQARLALKRLGYYRFSGYAHSLRERSNDPASRLDSFRKGTSSSLVVKLVEFDKALRMLVLQGLETIEIAVRAAVVSRMGKLDVEAHRNPALFDGRFTTAVAGEAGSAHEEWLRRLDELCAKSKEECIEHHRAHYGGRLPIWVVAEVLDFGLLSRWVAGLQSRDRRALSEQFGLAELNALKSWMHMFNVTRNRAAHHARIWNRTNAKVPLLPPREKSGDLSFLHDDELALKRLFGTLCCMRLVIRSISTTIDWHQQLKVLMRSFPQGHGLTIRSAGFPDAWDSLPLWRS